MNLTMIESKMNNPVDFLVRTSISPSWGHGLERSRSLLCEKIAVNFFDRYKWISLLTLVRSTSWSRKILVLGCRRGTQNPVQIHGLGLPVMKNFTSRNSLINLPRTERNAEDGWLSIHSSSASMTITHVIFALESGLTRSFSSWVMREVWAMAGLSLMMEMISLWKWG